MDQATKCKEKKRGLEMERVEPTMALQQNHWNNKIQEKLSKNKEALKNYEQVKLEGEYVHAMVRWRNKDATMETNLLKVMKERFNKPPAPRLYKKLNKLMR